jgi:hypothetical protein
MAKAAISKVSRKNALRFLANKTGTAGPSTTINEGEVAQRAYLIYLEEGCPEGRHLDHWLRAEAEVR